MKEFQMAIKDYKKAIELDPKYSMVYYNLGVAYYYMDDKVNACKSWTQAKALNYVNAIDQLNLYCK